MHDVHVKRTRATADDGGWERVADVVGVYQTHGHRLDIWVDGVHPVRGQVDYHSRCNDRSLEGDLDASNTSTLVKTSKYTVYNRTY